MFLRGIVCRLASLYCETLSRKVKARRPTSRLQVGGHTENGLYEIVHDLFHMPRVMRQLAVVQFFSWFALFAM